MPDIIWLKDKEGKYIACNEKYEKFCGFLEKDIIGKKVTDCIKNNEILELEKLDKEVIQHSKTITVEKRLLFVDEELDYEIVKTPMYDEYKNILGVLSIARDITEKKDTINAFNEAQSIAHIGSWKINLKDNTLKWSDECYRIFGIKKGLKVEIKDFLNALHPEDVLKVKNAWAKALESGKYDIEHRIIVNGRVKWVRERSRFVKNHNAEIISGIGTVQDITLYKKYEEKLLCLANSDQLTGLANRTLLTSILEKAIQISLRNNQRCALLLFDLDNFKDINDSFGHKYGDEVLIEIAKRLRKRVREADVVARVCKREKDEISQNENYLARLGGDEFAVVLTSLKSNEDAARVAKDIMEIIASPLMLSNNALVHINSSVGIAIAPDHSKNANEVLQYADTALYKAKNDGKLTFAYYNDVLTLKAKERIEGEARLREAIEKEEFEVYYQPQVHIKSQRIVGLEALIRWNKPDKGIIPPDEFIPLAEQSGLIVPLGEWILKEACMQTKKWLENGINIHISVNISANQIHYYDIGKLIDKVLSETQIDPNKLTLELTESTMMKREEQIVQKLHYIRSKGIKIAIDDFGTGYSSYSYLKRFPIDILKIDKSFIDDVPYEKDDIAIVSAIIAMGKAMGYQILAEGVEHKEQLEFLDEKGCDFYQGYYKSKPLPADEIEKLLNL